jgi:hypothetical protein
MEGGMSSRRKRQLNAEANERVKANHEKSNQAIRDAGGKPSDDIDAELKEVRHKRLVQDDEELQAFRAEQVEFFKSHYGQYFNDGITELPRDLQTRGYPALVRIEAYRSNWAIYDMEPANDLVVEYHVEYPDGFVPKPPPDMSVHEAALRTYNRESRITRFNDVENLAFNLIQYCLEKNLTGFVSLVQNEMQRRLPGVADAEIQAAYDRAHDEWVEAYFPSACYEGSIVRPILCR